MTAVRRDTTNFHSVKAFALSGGRNAIDWPAVIAFLRQHMTAAEIARAAGYANHASVVMLQTGERHEPGYSQGVALLDLIDRYQSNETTA